MRKVRIAQIGIGHDHADGIFNTLKAMPELFEIAGYALPEQEKADYAHKLDCFSGFPELTVEQILNDPAIEAVAVETEERNLSKYALLAARHGKHLHMDKPGGLSLAEFEQLIDTVRENSRLLHLGYMYRYNTEIARVLEEARCGQLGEVFCVEGQMSGIWPGTPEKRQWLQQFRGGVMFFLGCHMVDIVVRIMGKPEKIIPLNGCTGLEGVTSEDFAMAAFVYKNGTSFVKSCSREVGGGNRRQIVVCGSEKTAEIKPLEYGVDGKLRTDMVYRSQTGETRQSNEPFLRYDRMMEAFAAMVRGERENPYSYDYELLVYKCTLLACGYEGIHL